MSELTHLIAQRVHNHEGKLGNIELALDVHGHAIRPLITALELRLDFAARARQAADYHRERGADVSWQSRMPGAPAERRHAVRKALEDGALAALRMRDGSRDAGFRERAAAEAHSLLHASRALA